MNEFDLYWCNNYNFTLLDNEILEIAISQNDSSEKYKDRQHKTSHNKLSGKNQIKIS